MFAHHLIIPYSRIYSDEEELLWVVAALSLLWWYQDICASYSTRRAMRSLKRFNMKRCISKFVGIFYQSISSTKKALFCICRGLQLFSYCNRDEIRNLLIFYITNANAWLSVYSSYLPTPVKMVWVILSSYYRRAFVDDASHKSQETSLWFAHIC
jgi:hypothetical protein